MKMKRLGALLLALALAACVSVPALPPLGLATAAGAIPARDGGDQYFGKQLHEDTGATAAAAFYDAMVSMYSDGVFLTGADAEVPGVPAGLDAAALGSAVTTARDAFYMDYPDLFYLNFNNFAVKQDGGKVFITPGSRGKGYLLAGLDEKMVQSMVANYDAVLSAVVEQARAAAPQAGESAQAAQVRTVHDALTRRLVYRLDDVCAEANRPFIRTAYGLVTGEGVCEAYSRAFKSAMDALDIPCVLVEGVFRHSADVVEEHMWACVRVGELWYGVDVTMDDPGNDSYQIYTDYLLAGDDTMSGQHVASEAMSAAGYSFRYPSLVQDNYYVVTVHNDNGLTVRLDKMGVDEDMSEEGGDGTGIAYVSYRNMGYAAAAEKGYYIVARFLTVDPNTNDWITTQWGYLNPVDYGSIKDTATEVALPLPHIKYVEFGVTDIAPKILSDEEKQQIHDVNELMAANYYQGDPALLLATSGMQENPYGNYVAPPYIASASPSEARTLDIGQTYNVTLRFDDKLIPAEEGASLGYTLEAYTYIRGRFTDLTNDAAKNSDISPLTLSADGRTVTFTFRPSEKWMHDNIFYTFHFTGVVGERSGKAPNTLTYLAAHPCAACAFQSQGYDWNVFGKPQLLDDPSLLNTENWTTRDGQAIAEELKHRMTLVVTSPTGDQTDAMEELIKNEYGEPQGARTRTDTYSINLTLCKAQVITDGQAVRVMLGFPEGFDYDDSLTGATFKAYHYTKDEHGQITGVNEIPCIVTELGLLVLCDSFSPFAIVAEQGDEAAPAAAKTLIVKSGAGGSVEVTGGQSPTDSDGEPVQVDGVYEFSGDAGTCTVQADEGYTIESVTLGGESQAISNEGTMTVPLGGLPSGATTLTVTFAPTEQHWQTVEQEARDAFKAPEAAAIAEDLPAKMDVQPGESIELKASFTFAPATTGSLLQWYKDGQALAGQTGETLRIANADSTSAGQYTLRATTFAGPMSTVQESTPCLVTVAAPLAEPPTNTQEPTPTPTAPAEQAQDTAPAQDPTPSPTATAEPEPTAAPAQDPAPSPTATAEPTPAAAPTQEPEPTPAAPAEPTPAAAPTQEPAPTPAAPAEQTPAAAPVQDPTPTPAAPAEQTPAAAPTQDPTPGPTAAPVSTAAPQAQEEAPAPSEEPAPAPAAAAAPAVRATATPAPTPVMLGKGGPEPTPAPSAKPTASPAALKNTPTPAPTATPRPTPSPTPAPAKEKPPLSPMAAMSVAFFICAAVAGGGLAWLLIPRRGKRK